MVRFGQILSFWVYCMFLAVLCVLGIFGILAILFIFRVYVYVSIFCLTSRKANTCVTSVLDQYCARGRGQNFPRIRLVGGPFMNIMDIHICYTFLWPMRCSTLALGCASSAPSALVAVGCGSTALVAITESQWDPQRRECSCRVFVLGSRWLFTAVQPCPCMFHMSLGIERNLGAFRSFGSRYSGSRSV